MKNTVSVYNLSRQMDAFKRSMDDDDMAEVCQLLNSELDNTVILLYLRGDYSSDITSIKREESAQITLTKVRNKSIF
ncbi:MAG: hypothetical protein COB83_00640 [Gammaproteobacteria bacterium]|nr:MAG: hypothetical protein COB83_00640 [Gammaproteobacteria bacterium]